MNVHAFPLMHFLSWFYSWIITLFRIPNEESLATELSWTEITSRRTEYRTQSPTFRPRHNRSLWSRCKGQEGPPLTHSFNISSMCLFYPSPRECVWQATGWQWTCLLQRERALQNRRLAMVTFVRLFCDTTPESCNLLLCWAWLRWARSRGNTLLDGELLEHVSIATNTIKEAMQCIQSQVDS
jgi:hypothetical protein